MRGGDGGTVKRKIIRIDEDRCDGCGQCVPACAEGALQIIEGKARVVSDSFCDGLGACLGHCPQDAISIEERESVPFDEKAVQAHLAQPERQPAAPLGGCPSARLTTLAPQANAPTNPIESSSAPASTLSHWPVQLHLLPPNAPLLKDADLLLCAPCVPVALPDFQTRLLAGRMVALACPKLDDQTGYLEKLAEMMKPGGIRSLSIARMSVPCCGGLLHLAQKARDLASSDVPVRDLVVGHDGVLSEITGDEPGVRV